MLQLKDQGIFTVSAPCAKIDREAVKCQQKKKKKSGRVTIHQFTEKIVLFFVSGL